MLALARKAVLPFAMALGMAFGHVLVRADDTVPADRRLPKSTLACASLRSVNDLKESWQQTMFGRMLKDEAFADFLNSLTEQFKEFGDE